MRSDGLWINIKNGNHSFAVLILIVTALPVYEAARLISVQLFTDT